MKKRIIVFYACLVIILLIPAYFIFFYNPVLDCNDSTKSGECSKNEPYFCLDGVLIDSPEDCGCDYTMNLSSSGFCVNEYMVNPKEMSFNYTLRGEKKIINLTLYQGAYNYLSKLARYIDASQNPTLFDFRSRTLNEENQKALLMQLVVSIQNSASDLDDQARIAVSLVQNIPFGNSNKTVKIGNLDFEYYRYPYEVLYENQGVCGEKSALLAFLLKEIGYSSALLYYSTENHEVVGIRCPVKKGINGSGYCFIETTGPSIITDNQTEYVSSIGLHSEPKIIPISEGISFGSTNFYEYNDAKVLNKIRVQARKYGVINFIQNFQFQSLKKKYGLHTYEYTF